MLKLSDLSGFSDEEIVQHIIDSYEADPEAVKKFEVLVAYESVGSCGCDSSSFFLLREIGTGKLFENHGSHCSCSGFEGQFSPTESSVNYLQSEHFYFSCGGYEEDGECVQQKVKELISSLE